MRNTLTNEIDQAMYDAILKNKGRKAANIWAAQNVTLYDVFEAPRSKNRAGDREMKPGTAKFLFRATMENICRFLDLEVPAANRVIGELREMNISFVYHNSGRWYNYFHGIRTAEPNLTPKDGKTYEIPTDMKRLHEASFVAVSVPDPDGGPAREMAFDGRLMAIALDVGPHVWVHASHADDLPVGAIQVGDGRSPGYSVDGQRIISVPAEWCKFYTDEEANGIAEMIAADEALLRYAR